MNDLKPCPFCGGEATFWLASWTDCPRVGCKNKDCLIQPATPADTKKLLSVPEDVIIMVGTPTHNKLTERVKELWNQRK